MMWNVVWCLNATLCYHLYEITYTTENKKVRKGYNYAQDLAFEVDLRTTLADSL